MPIEAPWSRIYDAYLEYLPNYHENSSTCELVLWWCLQTLGSMIQTIGSWIYVNIRWDYHRFCVTWMIEVNLNLQIFLLYLYVYPIEIHVCAVSFFSRTPGIVKGNNSLKISHLVWFKWGSQWRGILKDFPQSRCILISHWSREKKQSSIII